MHTTPNNRFDDHSERTQQITSVSHEGKSRTGCLMQHFEELDFAGFECR
jgi:hypothetical protein